MSPYETVHEDEIFDWLGLCNWAIPPTRRETAMATDEKKKHTKSSRGKAITGTVRAARGTTDIRCQIYVNASSEEIKAALLKNLTTAVGETVDTALGISPSE